MFSLPIRLLAVVGLAFFLAGNLSFEVVSWFYTISVFLKDILMVILPFVVFSYLAASIVNLQGKATLMIFGIFALVIVSNMLSVMTAYGAANFVLSNLGNISFKVATDGVLVNPLWKMPNLVLLKADQAMLLGLVAGILCNIFKMDIVGGVINGLKKFSTKALSVLFIPFLPIYVFGFVLKIGFEGTLKTLATAYAPVFFLSLAVIHSYLFLAYLIGCNGDLKITFAAIKNMMPAWITGFSTMSSAATLPVTLECVEKNTNNQKLTHFVVPSTANIHMIGDGINITLTALALLVMSGAKMPTLLEFLPYLWAYIFTKFSGSGVPGGGMIILLPVVEQHLGLSPDLCSLVATLYILQDSLMTASNVAGNGALALIAKNIFKKIADDNNYSQIENQKQCI